MARDPAYSDEQAERLAEIYTAPSTVDRRGWFLDHLAPNPGEEILSIGCGPGYEPAAIADQVGDAGRVYGVDNSEDMLAFARDRCGSDARITVELAEATEIPAQEDRFDAAAAAYVYEYVFDLEAALEELARVIRPGGRACVISGDWDTAVWYSSNPDRMNRVLGAWKTNFADPSRGTNLRPAFSKTDLEVESIEPYVYLESDLDGYAGRLLELMKGHLEGVDDIDDSTISDWEEDLRTIDSVGKTMFSFTSFLYEVRSAG